MNDRLFKCLVESNRRRIIYCIGTKEMCVDSICNCLDLEQSLVSHHLRELLDCGLLERERRGKKNFYRVAEPKVLDLLEKARELGDRLEGCSHE